MRARIGAQLDGEYIQLTSWDELVAWIEREGGKVTPKENPAPVKKRGKKKPQIEELF